MRRLERRDRGVARECAARLWTVSGVRICSALGANGDEMLPRVTVTIPRAFVKALIEPRELDHRAREFDFWIRQLARLRRARPLVAVLKNLCKRGAIERAYPVLALEIEEVEHAARLVHEVHQLDAVGVEDPVNLLAELLSPGALLAADSSLLSERQGHRRWTERLNDRMILIEVQ